MSACCGSSHSLSMLFPDAFFVCTPIISATCFILQECAAKKVSRYFIGFVELHGLLACRSKTNRGKLSDLYKFDNPARRSRPGTYGHYSRYIQVYIYTYIYMCVYIPICIYVLVQ